MRLTFVLFALAAFTACGPGGTGYHATDRDPRLTKIARSAAPTRTAVLRFHDSHSRYPESDGELRAFMGKPPSALGEDAAHGWLYNHNPGAPGFSLWHKLGWDPALLYEFDGSKGQWVYDPGDGSDTQPILLQP